MNPFLLAKSDFIFGWVHIHIYLVKRDFYKNNRQGKLALYKPTGIPVENCMLDHPIPTASTS